MLFRRRKPAGLFEKLRGLFWPRKGFARPFHYIVKRILRLTASPHAIAAGVAAGVASSWSPFVGFHFLIAFAIAYLIAGNMIAAAIGTGFGNPLTFPFLWATTWEIGNRMLGIPHGDPHRHINLWHLFERAELSQLWGPIIKPMVVGCIPPALISGIVVYSFTYFAVRGFQARRKARLAERAKKRFNAAIDGIASV
ncbi:DUF2062 domain-containing protein [Agrobacterium sp. ES01]|uniref:DUF2062 domain-containing protein n=1 Tax=Agrobacterium sp. ES01 TaxID=3420714 RepID=UPI003D0F2CD5